MGPYLNEPSPIRRRGRPRSAKYTVGGLFALTVLAGGVLTWAAASHTWPRTRVRAEDLRGAIGTRMELLQETPGSQIWDQHRAQAICGQYASEHAATLPQIVVAAASGAVMGTVTYNPLGYSVQEIGEPSGYSVYFYCVIRWTYPSATKHAPYTLMLKGDGPPQSYVATSGTTVITYPFVAPCVATPDPSQYWACG